jgi:hypothetical protein
MGVIVHVGASRRAKAYTQIRSKAAAGRNRKRLKALKTHLRLVTRDATTASTVRGSVSQMSARVILEGRIDRLKFAMRRR